MTSCYACTGTCTSRVTTVAGTFQDSAPLRVTTLTTRLNSMLGIATWTTLAVVFTLRQGSIPTLQQQNTPGYQSTTTAPLVSLTSVVQHNHLTTLQLRGS